MHSRSATMLFLLFCAAVCLAEPTAETSTFGPVFEKSAMSKAAILLTVSVCSACTVLVVLIPTLAYHKYRGNNLQNEVV